MNASQQQQQRRIGSVNDIDPVNGYYGSIAEQQQQQLYHQQQVQLQNQQQKMREAMQQQQYIQVS